MNSAFKKIVKHLILVIICISACSSNIESQDVSVCPYADIVPNSVWNEIEGVTFWLEPDKYPIGTTEFTLIIDNQTNERFSYGEDTYGPLIEKYINGEWVIINTEPYDFTTRAYTVPPNSQRKLTVYADTKFFDAYDVGLYRISNYYGTRLGSFRLGDVRYAKFYLVEFVIHN
jgi:hypothetical protein